MFTSDVKYYVHCFGRKIIKIKPTFANLAHENVTFKTNINLNELKKK